MKICTKNYQIDVYEIKNIYQKFMGLMFKKEKINKAYFFKNCNSIHTFFMKQNIDIAIVDKNFNIVYLKDNLSKNKIIIKRNGKHTFELPLYFSKNLKLGEKINLKE